MNHGRALACQTSFFERMKPASTRAPSTLHAHPIHPLRGAAQADGHDQPLQQIFEHLACLHPNRSGYDPDSISAALQHEYGFDGAISNRNPLQPCSSVLLHPLRRSREGPVGPPGGAHGWLDTS